MGFHVYNVTQGKIVSRHALCGDAMYAAAVLSENSRRGTYFGVHADDGRLLAATTDHPGSLFIYNPETPETRENPSRRRGRVPRRNPARRRRSR